MRSKITKGIRRHCLGEMNDHTKFPSIQKLLGYFSLDRCGVQFDTDISKGMLVARLNTFKVLFTFFLTEGTLRITRRSLSVSKAAYCSSSKFIFQQQECNNCCWRNLGRATKDSFQNGLTSKFNKMLSVMTDCFQSFNLFSSSEHISVWWPDWPTDTTILWLTLLTWPRSINS